MIWFLFKLMLYILFDNFSHVETFSLVEPELCKYKCLCLAQCYNTGLMMGSEFVNY